MHIFAVGALGSYVAIGLIVALINTFGFNRKFPGIGAGASAAGVAVVASDVAFIEAMALWPYVLFVWATT